MQEFLHNQEYIFFNYADEFDDNLPFKAYKLEGFISGEMDHYHDYMQVWYIKKGILNHWINGIFHEMVKGDIFVIPPYVVHKVTASDNKDLIVVGCEFSPNFINNQFSDFKESTDLFDFAYIRPFLVGQADVKPKLHLPISSQIEVERIMHTMLEEYWHKDKYYEQIFKAELLKLLALVAREYGANTTKEERDIVCKYRSNIMEAIDYIDNNFERDIRLDDVCKISMLSKSYFSSIFKHITNKTFNEYLIQVRINNAIDLLVNTNKSITGICHSVGFNDVTHFCRTFKNKVGLSPTSYRESVLGI